MLRQAEPDNAARVGRGDRFAFAEQIDAAGARQANGGEADGREALAPGLVRRVAGQGAGGIGGRDGFFPVTGGEEAENSLLGGVRGHADRIMPKSV